MLPSKLVCLLNYPASVWTNLSILPSHTCVTCCQMQASHVAPIVSLMAAPASSPIWIAGLPTRRELPTLPYNVVSKHRTFIVLFFFWGELPPKFVSSHLHHTMTLVQLCHSSLVMFNWHRRSPLVTCLCPWLSSRWRGEAVLLLNIRSSFSVNESFLVTYLHYFLSQSILYHFFSIYRSWLFFAIYQYSTRILSLTLCIEISKSLSLSVDMYPELKWQGIA
jgi:hypothetical protein